MVVGDDEVEAELGGGVGCGEGADAGVNADDEADTFAGGVLEYFALHAVAFAEAMRDMEADGSAEALDGGSEEDDGGSSVHVVVTIYKDQLTGGDGIADAADGDVHAEHEEGIVELVEAGREECGGFDGCADATGDEQRDEERREISPHPLGMRRGGVRGAEDPLARRRLRCGRVGGVCLRRAHRRLDLFLAGVAEGHGAEAIEGFEQRLVALVPAGGAFVQKDDALIGEAEVDVADFADVSGEGLGLFEFRRIVIGEVGFLQFLNEELEVGFLKADFAHGEEGCSGGLCGFDEVLPAIGIVGVVPEDGGNLFADVGGNAAESVAGDEGHHIVFEREQAGWDHVHGCMLWSRGVRMVVRRGQVLCLLSQLSSSGREEKRAREPKRAMRGAGSGRAARMCYISMKIDDIFTGLCPISGEAHSRGAD